jgi:hypothetical protein
MNWDGQTVSLANHPDSLSRKSRSALFPRILAFQAGSKWNLKERTSLARGIRALHQSALMERFMNKHKDAIHELERLNSSKKKISHSYDSMVDTYDGASPQHAIEINQLKTELDGLESLGFFPGINFYDEISALNGPLSQARPIPCGSGTTTWDKIATQYVKTKSPVECFIQWSIYDSPSVNKQPWTSEELIELDSIVRQMMNPISEKALSNSEGIILNFTLNSF